MPETDRRSEAATVLSRNVIGCHITTMKLLIGWATQDITPDKAVELVGQYYQRISNGVRDPLAVTEIALEQRSAGRSEQAVMVSVDAVFVTADFQQEVREAVRAKIADLDPRMVSSTQLIPADRSCSEGRRLWFTHHQRAGRTGGRAHAGRCQRERHQPAVGRMSDLSRSTNASTNRQYQSA